MTVTIIPKEDDESYSIKVSKGRNARLLDLTYDELIQLQEELSIYVEPRDQHHTMSELYQYRLLYNAHAANAWYRLGCYPVVKSYRHSDGELCFGGGWFIVSVELPTGQVSNHYRNADWDLFDIPAVERAPEWDGHTPDDAAQRLWFELAHKEVRSA